MRRVSISWSSLRTWSECRQKAYLVRTQHKSPAQDIRGYFAGTVVDRVMRDWLNDPDQSVGAMIEAVDAIMDREEAAAITDGDGVVRWRHPGDRAEVAGFCRELVTRLEPILREYVLPFEYEPAKRFRTTVMVPGPDGVPTAISLVGEMDLLVRNAAGEFLIWDLKGTKDNSYWRKTVGQLVFYDLCTYAMFTQFSVGGGLIQPMCDQAVLPLTVTNQQRTEMMTRIIAMAQSIWAKDHAVAPDRSPCGYCEVRHACSRFAPVGDVGARRMRLLAI